MGVEDSTPPKTAPLQRRGMKEYLPRPFGERVRERGFSASMGKNVSPLQIHNSPQEGNLTVSFLRRPYRASLRMCFLQYEVY